MAGSAISGFSLTVIYCHFTRISLFGGINSTAYIIHELGKVPEKIFLGHLPK